MRREILDGRRGWMTAREVCLLVGDRNEADIYQALKSLRANGCVRFLEGSSRLMEIAPGAPDVAQDGRGRSAASRANLKRNTRASMASARPVRGRRIIAG